MDRNCATCGPAPVTSTSTKPQAFDLNHTDKPTCPIRMSDGRIFTDYRPRCHVMGDLFRMMKEEPVFTSLGSRLYLQHNADTIIDDNRANAQLMLGPCAQCTMPYNEPGTTELPAEYVVRCNTSSCTRSMDNVVGLGDKRDYAPVQ